MTTARSNVLKLTARRSVRVAALMLGVMSLFTAASSGQTTATPTNNGSQIGRRIPPPRDIEQMPLDSMGPAPVFYEKRMKMLNAAQHQSMIADTDRLLKLVADLNAQINTNNSNTLTPEQLRMVAEIEKLAHSVRDKMRMSVRSAMDTGPISPQPFIPR
jgi:hypothetical protein